MQSPDVCTFSSHNFHELCDYLASTDTDLQRLIEHFGYPPFWHRPPTFESLIHFILEQQVSLASAQAAMNQLLNKIGSITPQVLLSLSDDDLKRCYFSRQKIGYARCLAQAVLDGALPLGQLPQMSNNDIRFSLTQIKGIGDWTADVFMMLCLHRCDCWPVKDVALAKSIWTIKHPKQPIDKTALPMLGQRYQPYRTIAAYLYWHAYLESKKK